MEKKKLFIFLFSLMLASKPFTPHLHRINGWNVMGVFVFKLIKTYGDHEILAAEVVGICAG
jgi:hypothetical protein